MSVLLLCGKLVRSPEIGRFMMSQAFIATFTYLFFCLREISDFFGVAVRLYLFIDMSIKGTKQHVQREFCLHAEWWGPRGEIR